MSDPVAASKRTVAMVLPRVRGEGILKSKLILQHLYYAGKANYTYCSTPSLHIQPLDSGQVRCHNPAVNDDQKRPSFILGLKLAEGFFHEEVEPILKSHFPTLSYSAALIGPGSEVLAFDTEMSADHHWGPRVLLFLRPDDFAAKRETIRVALTRELSPTYRGYSTNFSEPDPEDNGTQMLRPATSGAVNHRVATYTISGFFSGYMNIDIDRQMEPVDWLTLPHQKLRSIISGRVFRDDLGLGKIRERFSWYPHDVWLYELASGWTRIGQEEHLMGRAGFVNDEIGSALIGARLVRDIMRLAFLMEKEYPPYAKWYGTAFSHLTSAKNLAPILADVLHSTSWIERETHLCQAYCILAEMHNDLKITDPLSADVTQFFTRPFRIIGGDRFAKAIAGQNRRLGDRQSCQATAYRKHGSFQR